MFFSSCEFCVWRGDKGGSSLLNFGVCVCVVVLTFCPAQPAQVVLQRFEPLQEDPLVRFNAFIRGNLREFVISQIGDELSVPYHICLVAFLPMIFYSSVNVLGCDNGPCASSAKLAGYRSVSEYMITQIVGWVLVFVLAFPLTYPLLLRMINCVLSFGDGPLQLLLAFLCCPLAYIYMYVCGGICWSSFYTLVKILGKTWEGGRVKNSGCHLLRIIQWVRCRWC